MQPHMRNNDKLLFYKYLDKSKVYFEFGSGGSTYQAGIRDNIEKVYSVESDKSWHNKIKSNLNNSKIHYLHVDINSKPNTWGYPGKNCTDVQKKLYSEQLRLVNDKNIDLIFIDGRFRTACCLKCFDIVNKDCVIIFDDFLNRKEQYHEVLNYFEVIDKTNDNCMAVLQKKKDVKNIHLDIIKTYELIAQ